MPQELTAEAVATLSEYDKGVLRDRALDDLFVFSKGILSHDWFTPEVHIPVSDFLSLPCLRKELCEPRGFLKTTHTTKCYVIWRYLKNKNINILLATNVLPNAQAMLHQIRLTIETNQILHAIFPEVKDAFENKSRSARWSDTCIDMPRTSATSGMEGTFEAAGIGTTIVSRHYDLIIEDDLINAKKDDLTNMQMMPTKEDIEKAIGWHKLAISLLKNPKDGEIINVGTRWGQYDLIRYIRDNETQNNTQYDFKVFDMNVYGVRQYPEEIDVKPESLFEEGRPVYTSRFDEEVLNAIKATQGSYIYSTQYLCDPVDTERLAFNPELIRRFDIKDMGKDERGQDLLMSFVLTIDPAISLQKSSDFTALVALGIDSRGYRWVVETRRGHWRPTETITNAIAMAKRWHVHTIGIEEVAFQKALVYAFEDYMRKHDDWYNIEGLKPGHRESKDLRIRAIEPLLTMGALRIENTLSELYTELVEYPFSANDDLVDALAYHMKISRVPMYSERPKPLKLWSLESILAGIDAKEQDNQESIYNFS